MSKERYIAAKQKWAEKQLAKGFRPREVATTDRLPPGKNGLFENHTARQLGDALAPFDEGDGHLADPAAGPRCVPCHLDLKGIAVRDDPLEWNPEQGLAPPAMNQPAAACKPHCIIRIIRNRFKRTQAALPKRTS